MALSEDNLHVLLHTVGRIAIFWSYIENSLDGMVGVIHHFNHARVPKKYSRLPSRLNEELELICWATAAIPSLSGLATQMNQVADELKELGKRRNLLIHGAATAMSHDGSEITLVKHVVEPKFRSAETSKTSLGELLSFAELLTTYARQVAALAFQVYDGVEQDARDRSFTGRTCA